MRRVAPRWLLENRLGNSEDADVSNPWRNGIEYLRRLMAGTAAVLITAPCAAHHSFAMFDLSRSITLHGTVKELQWTNPHCFLQLLVQARGTTAEWSLEMHSPAAMYRAGLRPGSFKPGDKVTVVINPLKDGASGGQFVSAIDASGTAPLMPGRPQS
jgi:phage-related protein